MVRAQILGSISKTAKQALHCTVRMGLHFYREFFRQKSLILIIPACTSGPLIFLAIISRNSSKSIIPSWLESTSLIISFNSVSLGSCPSGLQRKIAPEFAAQVVSNVTKPQSLPPLRVWIWIILTPWQMPVLLMWFSRLYPCPRSRRSPWTLLSASRLVCQPSFDSFSKSIPSSWLQCLNKGAQFMIFCNRCIYALHTVSPAVIQKCRYLFECSTIT